MPVGWIREIVFDCPDPSRLARFWASLVGGEPVKWYEGWVTLEPPPQGQRLSFQAVPNFRKPTWPDPGGQQMHVDLLVADLDAAHERVLAFGARFLAAHTSPRPGPRGEEIQWRVYADPVGHPFCLVVR